MFVIQVVLAALLLSAPGTFGEDEESTLEIYMLAFMNITSDNPTLETFQQIIISAYNEGTRFLGRTEDDNMMYLNYIIPTQAEDGIIGDHSISTTSELVATVDDVITKLGMFVVTDNEVSLQLSKSVQASADGYLALPLTQSSTSFYVASYAPFAMFHATYAIAAIEDNTCVTVYRINGSESSRIAFFNLNSYEVYNGLSDVEDPTGYYVESTKPVSVFGGHMCAEIPLGLGYCDHIQSQLPPIDEWGTEYIIPGIRGRLNIAGYLFRVIASEDDTALEVEGTQVATVSRGMGFYEEMVELTYRPTVVKCSKPCMVIQYNVGNDMKKDQKVSEDEKKKTDPYMMLVPPTSSYLTTLRFGTARYIAKSSIQEFENHLAIAVPTGSEGKVTLNLEYLPQATDWTKLRNGYSICNIDIEPGLYNIRTDTGDIPIMAFVYGHGFDYITAYGYPVGYKVTGEKLRTSTLQRKYGFGIDDSTALDGACEKPFNPTTVSSSDNLQRFYVSFNLTNELSEPCSTNAIEEMEGMLADIKNSTNWLICLDLLCIPAENTWVYSIDIVEPENKNPMNSISFLVTLWSSSSEVTKNAIACKRHVADYLSNYDTYSARWKVPLTVPGTSCADVLDFQSPGNVATANSRCAASYRT